MTPIGWVLFGQNVRPKVAIEPFRQQNGATSRLRANGVRLGMELAF